MVVFLILLVLLTIALRFRLRSDHYLFLKMRRPYSTELTLLLLSSALILIIQEASCDFKERTYLLYYMEFTAVLITWFFSYIFSSSVLKTTVTDMLLTPFFSNLRIDVDNLYIKSQSSQSSSADASNKIAGDISYLMSTLPYKTIVFESHLLRAGQRKLLSNNLRERGISFTVKERKTPLLEAMVLNLRYGGKTRYRLFTYLKHPNGFKVHRNGGAFKIHHHKLMQ